VRGVAASAARTGIGTFGTPSDMPVSYPRVSTHLDAYSDRMQPILARLPTGSPTNWSCAQLDFTSTYPSEARRDAYRKQFQH
jgi:hypothetical protein